MAQPDGKHGRVLQVNVSAGGVPKRPVAEAWVDRLGLAGDAHHDDTDHGGPHRAVALYALEAIRRVQEDGHPISPGSAGENLTTTGLELATLPVGTRLAIGERLVLELSKPDNPCATVAGNFTDGRFARISIATHPLDSRMYARVLTEGPVRPGDLITVLPPAADSTARLHESLDLFESVEQHEALLLWLGARAAGHDIRVLDDGDLLAAAAPTLDHPAFNRAYGLRQLPQLVDRLTAFYRAAGTTGHLVAADPPWPGAVAEADLQLVAGPPRAVPALAPPDRVSIHPFHDGDADRWRQTAAAVAPEALELPMAGGVRDAFLAGLAAMTTSHGSTFFLAEVDGSPVGWAKVFQRRGVALLGAAEVLSPWRGRGVHRALIAARARHAEADGALHVVAQACVGSPSARNLMAMGLGPIWTRHDYRYEVEAAEPAPQAVG
jgi:MOSC domain-containing protein YiiM